MPFGRDLIGFEKKKGLNSKKLKLKKEFFVFKN